MSLKTLVEPYVDRIVPEITELRHTLHRNPELAGNEVATSALVRHTLSSTHVRLLPPFLKTDVVGILNGRAAGRNVTLRADMDALPLTEGNDLPYSSSTAGLMHACGHDGHTAMLLGAARVLDQIRDRWAGTVRFVFQPGEEIAALGKALVDAGALCDPEPAAVFALHALSGYPVGSIISRPGTILAAAGFFKIRLIGIGGHGSKPEQTIDPIVAGCRLVDALQSIVSRNLDPQDAAVISICRFAGGHNANVIPEDVVMEGTFRYLDSRVGDRLRALMEQTIKGVCLTSGTRYEFEESPIYIPTVNRPDCVAAARMAVETYLGKDRWIDMPRSMMGGEDFAFYLNRYPGAFCFIGIGENVAELHNPKFDFSDAVIRDGILYLVGLALETLKEP